MDNELGSLQSSIYIKLDSGIQDSWQPFAFELGGQSPQQQKITHHRSSNNIKPASNPSGNMKKYFCTTVPDIHCYQTKTPFPEGDGWIDR